MTTDRTVPNSRHQRSTLSRCSNSQQSHNLHSTSTENLQQYVHRLERTAYKYVATEPTEPGRSVLYRLMLPTNGVIPHKLHDSLTLINLRHVLYIPTQKAVILNTCRTVGSFWQNSE